MINREIVYERNATGSYMKIPAGMEMGLDEQLMLHRKLTGVLPVEKVYVDGGGQYWYNISGKQSLDTYCRVKSIGMDLIEQLIISICSLMERLEWNLIESNCLMLDPELIFVNSSSLEFLFTLYPVGNHRIEQEFQQLMEYLMKKTDHQDVQAVKVVYQIYEQTLVDGYAISDVRSCLIRKSQPEKTERIASDKTERQKKEEEPVCIPPVAKEKRLFKRGEKKGRREKEKVDIKSSSRIQVNKKETVLRLLRQKFVEWEILQEDSREPKNVIYPDKGEEIEENTQPVIHPTVCLMNVTGQIRGQLLYIGNEGLSDIVLEDGTTYIGYGADADICINKETISQLHARIDRSEDGVYIQDLNSTNGTYVNEQLLAYKERRKLIGSDVVRFADVGYRFC